MLGSLDVTKIHWANCPNAWKGHFQGKEGYPTIALEAVADYNLWVWHDSFGLPGGLNDINIWERSPLLESMLNGTHSEIDHPLKINNQMFNQLFYLVDGIYPWLLPPEVLPYLLAARRLFLSEFVNYDSVCLFTPPTAVGHLRL